MSVKGWIFDLDSCLLDNARLGRETDFFAPVLDIVRTLPLPPEQMTRLNELLWVSPFEDIVREMALSEDMAGPVRQAYCQLEILPHMPIHDYDDTDALEQLSGTKILVTTGYQKLQSSKIACLGIAPLFSHVAIDLIDDPAVRRGKKAIFADFMAELGWLPEEVVVVGDNPASELAAGQALGTITVQTVRPGVVPWSGADYRISHLSELRDLIF